MSWYCIDTCLTRILATTNIRQHFRLYDKLLCFCYCFTHLHVLLRQKDKLVPSVCLLYIVKKQKQKSLKDLPNSSHEGYHFFLGKTVHCRSSMLDSKHMWRNGYLLMVIYTDVSSPGEVVISLWVGSTRLSPHQPGSRGYVWNTTKVANGVHHELRCTIYTFKLLDVDYVPFQHTNTIHVNQKTNGGTHVRFKLCKNLQQLHWPVTLHREQFDQSVKYKGELLWWSEHAVGLRYCMLRTLTWTIVGTH